MTDLYKKVEEYVKESFDSVGGEVSQSRKRHSIYVVQRMRELVPKADEAMLIAAVAHDIDGAFNVPTPGKIKNFNTPDYRLKHQNSSAKIISEFLITNGADVDLMNRVKHLVEKHEDGGDSDQDLLKDADSLGFFDEFQVFISIFKTESKEKLFGKTKWMYERITTSQAKELAKPMYEEAIKKLEEK